MAFDYKKIFDLAIKILVLLVILVTVKTNVDRANSFSEATPSGKYVEINSEVNYDLYLKSDPRVEISQDLSTASILLSDRSCGVEGSLENRKRLRWVYKVAEYKIYNYLYENVSNVAPYYFNVILYSVFLLISLIIIGRVVPINMPQYFVFMASLLYIFQFQLAEMSYSVLEMLFISIALYASFKKNILLLAMSVVFAIHVRESGVLLPFFWLIFNRTFLPIIISLLVSVGIWMGVSNFDIIDCIFNNNFLLVFDRSVLSNKPQSGQISFGNLLDGSLSLISGLRLITEGYLIPITTAFFLSYYCALYNKKKIIIAIIIYLLIFILATPLLHHSVKMILIPFFVLLSSKTFMGQDRA